MRIPFDRELARGIEAYDDILGRWWQRQSSNAAHRYAYRRIADYVAASFQDSPGVIVDYACGAGNLLCNLATRFVHSRLIGLDGSSYLLALAEKRLARLGGDVLTRVALIRTALPNPDVRLKANMALFTFPNMLSSGTADWLELKPMLSAADLRAARAISIEGADTHSRASAYLGLLRNRSVARNLRALLFRGGHCVRVEYGGVPRDQMTRAERMWAAFEEGTFDGAASPGSQKPWFRIVASAYIRSGAIEDVHHQSGRMCDTHGGYQITILRAV